MSGVAEAAVETAEGAKSLPISFSIVGVQKAATSTLYGMLTRHRQIARGELKERHFFDSELRNWEAPSYEGYRAAALRPRHRVAGDATPIYLFWPHALERMHAYNPEMRLIASFRDPIERAFSQWSMERGREAAYPDFGEAVLDERYRTLPEDVGRNDPTFRTKTLVARGLYAQQLRRGFELFDPQQWLLLDFRGFLADSAGTLARTVKFLGLPGYKVYPELQTRNSSPDNHVGKAPSADDIARLADYYADDLADFAKLTGIDTSAWPTVRIVAGDLDPAELAEKLGRRAGLIS